MHCVRRQLHSSLLESAEVDMFSYFIHCARVLKGHELRDSAVQTTARDRSSSDFIGLTL